MVKVIKWFTMKEIWDALLASYHSDPVEPNGTYESPYFLNAINGLGLYLRYVGIKLDGTQIKQADVTKYIQSLVDVVFDRQHDNYMYKIDEDRELTENDIKKALNKFLNVMNLTMPKYIPLLFQYEKNYEDTLRKVESESESFSRFNDTPQNEQDDVDYNTDDYASTMGRNKNISKVDSNSIPLKLKELQENFKSIILEWSNEFDMIFIDEYQLED